MQSKVWKPLVALIKIANIYRARCARQSRPIDHRSCVFLQLHIDMLVALTGLVPSFTINAIAPMLPAARPTVSLASSVAMQLSDDSGLTLQQKIQKQLGLQGGGLVAYAMFREDCKEAFTAAAKTDGKLSLDDMKALMDAVYGKETTEEEAAAMMVRAGSDAGGVVNYEAWIQQFLEDCEPPASSEKKGGFFGMFG